MVRYKIVFSGYVQGVGFRWRLKHTADMYGVTGSVENLPDMTVLAQMQGTEDEIEKVISLVGQSPYIEIYSTDKKKIPVIPDEYGFEIIR